MVGIKRLNARLLFMCALPLAFLYLGCTGTRGNKADKSGSSKGLETQTNGPAIDNDDWHYVVNMRFSQDHAQPESAVKEAGAAVLLVIPASDLFLAIYEDGRLTYFYDFPDPLKSRGTGGVETQQASAMGAVWFPSWMSNPQRAEKADAAIYTVTGYTSAFSDQVQTKASLSESIKKGTFKKTYALEGNKLSAFLNAVK